MRAYISGPISGTTDYEERFAKAEEELLYSGYEVVNPAAISAILPDMRWEEYMKVDLTLLDMCDMVYFLIGWENSKGCLAEHRLATYKGMKVIYEESNHEQG